MVTLAHFAVMVASAHKKLSSPCFWSRCWLVPEDQWIEPSAESTGQSHRSLLIGYLWANLISKHTEMTKYDTNKGTQVNISGIAWNIKCPSDDLAIINKDLPWEAKAHKVSWWVWYRPARNESWLDLLGCWLGSVHQSVEPLALWNNAATPPPWLPCTPPKQGKKDLYLTRTHFWFTKLNFKYARDLAVQFFNV